MANEDAELCLKNFLKLPYQVQLQFFDLLTNFYIDFESLSAYLNHVSLDFSRCESPIEMMMAMGLDIVISLMKIKNICVEQQVMIDVGNGKKRRVDFLLTASNKMCAVECDGHKYHSSKEQIKNDNQRDLELKKAGVDVLHFSGSQINARPWKCAIDTICYVCGIDFKEWLKNGKHKKNC